jgi:hypothetical protein
MRLPGGERAVVDAAKVRDYLLSLEHPVGRTKARFFAALGFTRAEWPALRRALLELAASGEATPTESTRFGQKYVVRGTLRGPAGRAAGVLSAWIVLAGEDFPRLVTAYPDPGSTPGAAA